MTTPKARAQEALKPCPACGAVPKLCEFGSMAFGKNFQIDCENPQCCITISSMCRNSADDAMAAWNTRTPSPAINQELADTLKRCDEQMSEAVHTAFRKGSDSVGSNLIWRTINSMPEDEWENIVDFIVDGLGVKQALEKHAAAVKRGEGCDG